MTAIRKLMLLVLLVITVSIIWWLNQPHAPEVTLHTLSMGKVESTIANTRTGSIMACRRSHIVPITSGRVDKLFVKEGDTVKQGEPLLTLWNDDLKAQLNLANSERNAVHARADEACVTAQLAQRDADRLKQLQSKGLTSVESYDQAQNHAVAREAACRAAKASVEVAESQQQVAQANLQRTRLKAPFDGVIAEVNAELGEVLAPLSASGQLSSAVDMIETGCLYISAPIDEIDAPAIKPNMQAHITLDAFPDTQFPGQVQRVAPYILDLEKQARTVEVEVVFTDPEIQEQMLPGYSTDVEIVLASKEHTLWLPTNALLRDNFVWRYQAGSINKVSVEIGLSNWQISEITSGLNAGDQIVIPSGDLELTEGMTVTPKAESN